VIYGLIFDIDGVIADTEPVNARASIKVFKDLYGIAGMQPGDFTAGLGRGAEKYMEAGATAHGLKLSEKELRQTAVLREKNILEIIRSEGLKPFPGVLALAHAALMRSDFRTAIATSADKELADAMLTAVNMPFGQMVYITGDQVKQKKPDPQIFLLAIDKLQLTPQNCVVVEDAPDGVKAAQAAGCKCIAVTNSVAAEKLAQADLIVNSLTEINTNTIIKLVQEK